MYENIFSEPFLANKSSGIQDKSYYYFLESRNLVILKSSFPSNFDEFVLTFADQLEI